MSTLAKGDKVLSLRVIIVSQCVAMSLALLVRAQRIQEIQIFLGFLEYFFKHQHAS